MGGLVSYGAYVPYYRLPRAEIATALGKRGGRGTRAVASYDEDTTSMAVEAARPVVRSVGEGLRPRRVYFATANPAYLDKTNAVIVHAALGLGDSAVAVDMMGSMRSTVGALLAGLDASEPTLVLASDVRFGPAGSAEESESGDAAAAFLFAPGDGAVSLVGHSSATREFLDRWRLPEAPTSRVWEERFGEGVYRQLAGHAWTDALKQAALTPSDVDHLVVAGLHGRAVRAFPKDSGVAPEAVVPDHADSVGNTGAAAPLVGLAAALDRAKHGQVVALAVLADGASVLLFRVGDDVASARAGRRVADQAAGGADTLRYTTFLAWRGMLEKESPRRPDPPVPAPPSAARLDRYKYGLIGARCTACGNVHLPPSRVCVTCHAQDRMVDAPVADTIGTVRTFTVDHLVYSPNPPAVSAVLDLDGGGRFTVDLTDVDPAAVAIGDRIEMTFRRLHTTGGVHNYFWKGRPAR